MATNGRIRREGEVVHLLAQQLFDLSGDIVGLSDRDGSSSFRRQGEEFAHCGGPDPRDKQKTIGSPRDVFAPDLHIDTPKVKARIFH